ncbi:MAG TPA: TIGR03067 domain-containing protein [Gemmata sp.]
MNRFVLSMVCGAVAGSALADPKAEEVKKAAVAKALEAFTGPWEILAVTPDGAAKGARRLVFKTDGTYAALDTDGKELWAGTFEIDPTATPKVWDHRAHDAKKTGTDVLGIYDLDGDKLKVACVVGAWKGKEWVGKPRPKAIDPKGADVVIELKRTKVGK